MRTGFWILSTLVVLATVGCGQPNGDTSASSFAMEKTSADAGAYGSTRMVSKMQAAANSNGQSPADSTEQMMQTPTEGGASATPMTGTPPTALAAYHPGPAAPPIPQREIIRNADLAVRVKAIEPSEHEIEKLIASEGGYVDSASSTDLSSDHPEIKLALRVPVRQFESTINSIEAMGVRLSKTVNSQDVTGQLIDMDARLTTMTDEEHVYQNLLKSSQSLQTAMELRDKLTDLRSQIESIAGQRKSMGELAALSSISVTLTQTTGVAVAAPVDAGWFQETSGRASTFSLGAARMVIAGFLWLLWLAPFWVPAGLIARWYFVKLRKSGATLAAPVSTIQ